MSKNEVKTANNLPEQSGDDETAEAEVLKPQAPSKGMLIAEQTMFIGPLPSPECLRAYGEVIPNLPETLINNFQTESAHRRACEKKEIELEERYLEHTIWAGKAGMVMAFVLSLLLIVGGFFLIYIGKDVIGVIAALVGIIPALGKYFMPRSKPLKVPDGKTSSTEK